MTPRESQPWCDSRLWAYLNDPMPTSGPRPLFAQKNVVDLLAARTSRRIERYIVDSGGKLDAAGRSVRLSGSLARARASRRRVTIAVASVGCLASTTQGWQCVLADLLGAGVAVEDPSGALLPSQRTVAHAQAAARRAVPRARAKTPRGRDVRT